MSEERTDEFDPSRPPKWLMDAAAKADPVALGFLASGFLSGVEAARKEGACMSSTAILRSAQPGLPADLACELAHGHPGGHRRATVIVWADASLDSQEQG